MSFNIQIGIQQSQTVTKTLDEMLCYDVKNLPSNLLPQITKIISDCHEAKVSGQSFLCHDVSNESFKEIEVKVHRLFLHSINQLVNEDGSELIDSLQIAARVGHVEGLKVLLSSDQKFSIYHIQNAIEEACKNRQIHALDVLLADPRAQGPIKIYGAITNAARMGFVDVLAKLHNKYNNFDKYDLSIAIKIAAQYNHLDTLQFLCQQCGEIPNNIIEVGMRSAISFNQIDSLRVLFSNYSTKITQQFLYDCIQQSADLGNLGILHFLLLNTEVIPTKMHENLILTVCDKGDVQSLEILLSKGTVSAVIRDYAISKAQRENKDDICQMLGQAKISCESIIFPTEIETLARSGYYWKFYRSEIYSGKDKVFIFKADSSLNQNQLDQLFIEHFPAIEGGASTVQPVNTLIKHILVDPRLEQLYYHVYQIGSEKYYQTPDPETLKKQWEKNHQFPLSISVVKGIITDQEYAQSFLDYDLIISEEKEFMHDTTVHVINTLLALMNKKDLFLAYKKHEREVIRSGIAFIDKNQYKLSDDEKNLLWFGLGIYADRFNDRVILCKMEEEVKLPVDIKRIGEDIQEMAKVTSHQFRSKNFRHNRNDFIEKLRAAGQIWTKIASQ